MQATFTCFVVNINNTQPSATSLEIPIDNHVLSFTATRKLLGTKGRCSAFEGGAEELERRGVKTPGGNNTGNDF